MRPGPDAELPSGLIAAGETVVRVLDAAGLPPDTAFWMWFRDVKGWRLVLSGGPLARLVPKAAMARVRKALDDADAAPGFDPDLIGVMSPDAAPVAAIRGGLATGPGFHGIRLRNNRLAGVVIPGAYVYRAN